MNERSLVRYLLSVAVMLAVSACSETSPSNRLRLDGAMETSTSNDSTVTKDTSLSTEERCGDAVDNDSDNRVDEGCECTPPEIRECYTGAPSTRAVGLCKDGRQTCGGAPAAWGTCEKEVLPVPEEDTACDELDNDCDGMTDEGVGASCCQTLRVQGPNRFASTVAVSQQFYPGGAQNAVLFALQAGDYPNPDGIVGGALAAKLGGPALGTYHANDQKTVFPGTKTELARLNVQNVYLIGGIGAIAPEVATELTNAGYSVTRFAGENRAHTAALVAAQMGAPAGAAFIVNQGVGDAPLVDGAIVAGLAGRLGYPILYVSTDAVPPVTTTALDDLDINTTYVVGGTSAVSDTVFASLPNPTRVSGPSRYETGVAVANQALSLGLTIDEVVFISGLKPLDAMGAAAAGRVHLLVAPSAPLPSSVANWLSQNGPTTGYIIGGTSVLDASVESAYCPTTFP